jgi:microcin C transport system permease protein
MQARGIGSGTDTPTSGAAASLTEEYRKQLEVQFGFDKPFLVRYWQWLVRDRLGMRMDSYKFPGKTAWQLIRERFPVSAVFGITGFLLSYLICIPLGISKALRNGTHFDLTSSLVVVAGYAIPPVALGMLLRTLLCGTVDGLWDVFPLAGFRSVDDADLSMVGQFLDVLHHMFLPVLCYVAGNFALLTMMMKNALLEQIGKDYVRTVLAKGGTRSRAIWGHAVRNALIPIATGFGGILTLMFAGSVIIERMFEIPGMGRLSLTAIIGRDYAVFMGILSLTSILILLGNVLSDLCYVLIDPRIDFER